MNDPNNLHTNLTKNLETVSSKISSGRSLVNQVTKEINLSSDANLDFPLNFNTLPLVHAHRLKNPKKVIKLTWI